MNPTINAVRLGAARGWIEFKMLYLKNPQGLISTVILAILFVGVLWFERMTSIEGVSLALLTLPGLLGMFIANEGLSDVAKLLGGYFGNLLSHPRAACLGAMDCPGASCLLVRVGASFGVFTGICSRA